MKVTYIGVGVLLMALTAGCASTGQGAPQGAEAKAAAAAVQDTMVVPTGQLLPQDAQPVDADNAAPAAPITADYFDAYRIGPGDILAFRSFDDESLSSPVTVRYDGHISLPLIADIKVNGLTREEAAAKVKAAFSEMYQDPVVTLTVLEPRSKKISVLGDVGQPADYFYTQPMTLLDAIAGAGGIRAGQSSRDSFVGTEAKLVKALLIRHANGERQVFEYDLRGLEMPGAHASDAPVIPGDIIYVPQSVTLVYVLGAVRMPGVFPMSDNMTLLQLVTRAGGFDEALGRMKQVVVIRGQDKANSKVMLVDAKDMLKTGADLPLQAGDIVYVPRKPLVKLQTFVEQLTGSISPVLSLYRQAWDSYYTKDLYDATFDNGGDRAYDLVSIQQSLQSLSTFSGALLK